jgi:hypothetical protein
VFNVYDGFDGMLFDERYERDRQSDPLYLDFPIRRPPESIHGLNIRVLLAQARITALVNPEEAEQMLYEIGSCAQAQGREDAQNGNSQPPLMFAGEEQYLLRPWRWGFNFERERQEMADCPQCQDGSGNPCPWHG